MNWSKSLFLRATAVCLSALAMSAAHAVYDPTIYSGEAPVASQDAAERARALGPALLQVLIKASGDSSISADANLARALEQAPKLVRQFSYRQGTDAGPNGTTVARSYLVAQFEVAGVERILQELRRPIWGADRPATLVWLVIDDGSGSAKRIASAAQISALGAMTKRARDRGITLKLPQMDAQDAAKADAQALWEGAPAVALAAAQRYGTPATMVARLSRAGSGWAGRFTLVDGTGIEEWKANFVDSNSVLAAGASGLAERLARRYAIGASERQLGDFMVRIAGLASAADYGSVLTYLGNLPVVSAVTPEGADGDALVLHMTLSVAPERLRQLLALQNLLVFDDSAAPSPGTLNLKLLR